MKKNIRYDTKKIYIYDINIRITKSNKNKSYYPACLLSQNLLIILKSDNNVKWY